MPIGWAVAQLIGSCKQCRKYSRPTGNAGNMGNSALWALHALTLTASCSGLAFVAHVRSTLQLCQDLLVGG